MLHAKSMAVVIAYDLYLECAEGHMRAGEWKQAKPVSFHRFREKLATQMLEYDPRKRKYLGDERFRASTSQHKSRRPPLPTELSHSGASGDSTVTSVTSKSIERASGRRLCGDLCPLIEHMSSIRPIPHRNSKVCVVCGKDCYHVCTKCIGEDGKAGVAMHAAPNLRGVGETGIPCYLHYHNTSFFGLARSDYRMAGISNKGKWVKATPARKQQHYKHIKGVLTPINSALNGLRRQINDNNNEDNNRVNGDEFNNPALQI